VDNRTFLAIISITQDLAYAVTFLLAAGAAYLALRQPRVKLRLDDAGPLVTKVWIAHFELPGMSNARRFEAVA
jgi:hypothetical protein